MSDTIDASRHARRRDAMLHSRRPAQIIEMADAASRTALYFPELDELDVLPTFRSQPAVMPTTGGRRYSTLLFVGTSSTPGRQLVGKVVANEGIPVADLIGTVGMPDFTWIESATTAWPLQTRSAQAQRRSSPQQRPGKTTAALRAERLTAIQASFSLPIQALAGVLGVSRPNLYKWLDASKDIDLQEANVRRLAAVQLLADRWQQVCSAPLSSVMHEPVSCGRTVLEMLTAETIDSGEVISAFEELAARITAQPKTRSQLRAEAGFRRRPTARALQPED